MFQSSVKEIDNVQLGIFNQAKNEPKGTSREFDVKRSILSHDHSDIDDDLDSLRSDSSEEDEFSGLNTLEMERRFLSSKGRGVRRGVREKHDSIVGKSAKVGVHGNVALGSISNIQSIFDVNAVLEYPNVSEAHGTQAQTSVSKENMNEVGTTMGPTLIGITPEGNGIDVVVPVEFIQVVKLHGVPVIALSEDGLSVIAAKLAMIELRADVKLKDNIVVAMPKIFREGNYTCNIRVKYEWKPPKYASCKVFGNIPEECPKNIGDGETKNLKKTSQAPKGIPVGPKVGFKPHKEYRPVSKKPIANSSGNKKKGVDHTDKLSDSDPFEVLNSVDNDVEMGTNGGMSNSNNNEANSTILVDEIDNPLKKVEYPDDQDSEDEVASVDNDMARSLAKERTGFGTQSLLEQWRDSYVNGDYDEDLYDDDMYEGHDLFKEIQTICDKLDI
ncbi:hypothetical protein Tco_1071248 [Tanacetum coccineum]